MGNYMDDNSEKFLLKLERFFVLDLKIKKSMYQLKPPSSNESISEEYIIKYVDNLLNELKYIFDELKDVLSYFGMNDSSILIVNDLYKKCYDDLLQCGYDRNKLEKFYLNDIVDMSNDLVDSVKNNCIGYFMFRSIYPCLEKTNTINELLHVIHSYIINNENYYKKLNVIDKKENNYKYPITLYGENGELAKSLFDSFPPELDCAWTDIVSLERNHKIFMMIRDRGHATTIELDINGNDIMVNYFIPKICNVEKINNLKGVHKVSLNSDVGSAATGMFISSRDKITSDLYDFISMIPTDADMVFQGIYEESKNIR